MITDQCRLLRALHVLVLIASSQIPTTSALPYGQVPTSTVVVHDPDCNPEGRPPQPVWPSVHGIEYTVVPTFARPTQDAWNPTAYEIPDGQVQVSASISTEAVEVTELSTTFLSSCKVTRYYTYTPLPRQYTSATTTSTVSSTTTRTSYVTIFVTASPAPAVSENPAAASTTAFASASSLSSTPVQSFTTSIPEILLTSLTTSEVQTVTTSASINNTGVSTLAIIVTVDPGGQ
jgi:hypothetical protein